MLAALYDKLTSWHASPVFCLAEIRLVVRLEEARRKAPDEERVLRAPRWKRPDLVLGGAASVVGNGHRYAGACIVTGHGQEEQSRLQRW